MRDGNEPAEPEGTPFVAKRDGFVLYPAMYEGRTTADGKTFISIWEQRVTSILLLIQRRSLLLGVISALMLIVAFQILPTKVLLRRGKLWMQYLELLLLI